MGYAGAWTPKLMHTLSKMEIRHCSGTGSGTGSGTKSLIAGEFSWLVVDLGRAGDQKGSAHR